MDTPQIETFDAWGMLEIMGHNRFAGRMTNASIGGGSFLRIDIPQTKNSQAFTKYFGAGSIYCITPTDEATARAAAEHLRQEPPIPYEMQRALPAPASRGHTERTALDDVDDFIECDDGHEY